MVEVIESRRFVGRGAELARLEAALRGLASGTGAAVIVGGEAGIGKSHLVAHFAQGAREAGATVLVGASLEFGEGGVPYAPFVEALRSLVRSIEPERLPALLGPARAELARLLPELTTRAEAVSISSELDRNAPARLFELVLGVLERLGRTAPVVVVVEDVQWADPSTRDLLAFPGPQPPRRPGPVRPDRPKRGPPSPRRDPAAARGARAPRARPAHRAQPLWSRRTGRTAGGGRGQPRRRRPSRPDLRTERRQPLLCRAAVRRSR